MSISDEEGRGDVDTGLGDMDGFELWDVAVVLLD